MISIEFHGTKELAKKLESAGNALELVGVRETSRATIETRNALFQAMSADKVADDFLGFRSPSGPALAARTGHTRRSLSPGRVWRVGPVVYGAVGHPSPHVLALETGAVVRPTASRYLRIPLAAALTGAGQDRNVGRSVRGVPGFFLWPNRKMRRRGAQGPTFLARNVNGRLVLWYLLKREVKLPEKRIFKTTREAMAPRYLTLLGSAVSTVVARAN